MLGINTNNNVESWHSNLKMNYLGKDRKIRPDALIYNLLVEDLPDLMVKVLRVSMGLEARRMATNESFQLEECMKVLMEIASEYVQILTVAPEDDQCENLVTVRSFQDNLVFYKIFMTDHGYVSGCICPYMAANHVVCKHMFMVKRTCGYNIDYDTRENVGESSNLMSSENPPQPEEGGGKELPESMFDRVVGGLRKGFFNLGAEEQKEMMEKTAHWLRQVQYSDVFWSQRQR